MGQLQKFNTENEDLELFVALFMYISDASMKSNLDPILHFRCHLLAKLCQQLNYKIEFSIVQNLAIYNP